LTGTAHAHLVQDILAEMRAQGLQRLRHRQPGHYVPPKSLYQYYQQVRSSQKSNSDELDGGADLIKAAAQTWASKILMSSQSGTTDATNTLTQTMDQARFFAKMEQSRQQTLSDTADAINDTYDKAEAEAGVGGTHNASEILAAAQLAEFNLNAVAAQIYVFLKLPTAVSAEAWAQQGPALADAFYKELVAFIQVAFE